MKIKEPMIEKAWWSRKTEHSLPPFITLEFSEDNAANRLRIALMDHRYDERLDCEFFGIPFYQNHLEWVEEKTKMFIDSLKESGVI